MDGQRMDSWTTDFPIPKCPLRTVYSGSGSGLGNVLNQTGGLVSGETRKYKNWTKPDFSNTRSEKSMGIWSEVWKCDV